MAVYNPLAAPEAPELPPIPQVGGALGMGAPVPPSPASGSPLPATEYDSLFDQAEQKYGLPPGLLKAVAAQESRFNPKAVSPKGAAGLMQFMPDTAKQYGIDPLDPVQAVDGAARHLTYLGQKFGGDIPTAIAAYNAGEGNVETGRAQTFPETLDYVPKVMAYYKMLQGSTRSGPQAGPAPRQPMVGFNDETGEIFSGGKVFQSQHGSILEEAARVGLLNVDNPRLPPGFRPVPAAMVQNHLKGMLEGRSVGNTLGEFGEQLVSGGARRTAQMVNQVGAAFSPAGGGAERMFNENAQSWEQSMPVPDVAGRGTIAKGFIEAAPNAAPSLALMAAGAIPGVGPAGAAAAGATLFGGSQFTETYNKLIADGRPADEAFVTALGPAAAQGLGEGLGTGVGAVALKAGGGAFNILRGALGRGGVEAAVKQATTPAFLAHYGTAMLGNTAVQAGTEYAQDYFTAALENRAGLQSGDPHEVGKHSAYISLYLSAMMGGLGAPAHVRAAGQREALGRALQDVNLPPDLRLAAAATVAERISPQVGSDQAKAWLDAFQTTVAKEQTIGPAAPADLLVPQQVETRTRLPGQQAVADAMTLPRQPLTQQPELPGMPDTAGFQNPPPADPNALPPLTPEGRRYLDLAEGSLQAGDPANARQLIDLANAPPATQQRPLSPAEEQAMWDAERARQEAAARPQDEQAQWEADRNTLPGTQAELPLPQPQRAAPDMGPFADIDLKTKQGRAVSPPVMVKRYAAAAKNWLANNAGPVKARWTEGIEYLVPFVPTKLRAPVRAALLNDKTYKGLRDPAVEDDTAVARGDLVRDEMANQSKLTKAEVRALAENISDPDGYFAPIHKLLSVWDNARQSLGRSSGQKTQAAAVQRRQDAADELYSQFATLEAELGANNIDAAMAYLKGRTETTGELTQPSNLTKFSIAWKQYKTRELGHEGLRGTRIRGNKIEENQAEDEKDFASKIEAWMGGFKQFGQETEKSDGTAAGRLDSLLRNLEKKSNKLLTTILSDVLRHHIKRNKFAPKIVVSKDPGYVDRGGKKIRVYGKYNHGENTVYLYAGGHNQQILFHELIHALTVRYIAENFNSPLLGRMKSLLGDISAAPTPDAAFAKEHGFTDTDTEQLALAIESTVGMWKTAKTDAQKRAALSEFVTYGMTQPQFQQWLGAIELKDQAGQGAPANESFVVDNPKRPTKKGLPGKKTIYTAWTKFRSAVSLILTGKSWANRDNRAISHFIDQTSLMLRDLDKSAAPVTPKKSDKTVSAAFTQTEAFKRWFGNSKVVDAEGKPLVLYRGAVGHLNLPDGFLNGEPRDTYAVFASDNPHLSNTYANPDHSFGGTMVGAVTPLYVKADKLIEFPTTSRGGYNSFDMFEFDRRATRLAPGEVLVARQVSDPGPRRDEALDPDRLWSYSSDVYAWNKGTSVKSAVGNAGDFDAGNPDILAAAAETERSAYALNDEGGNLVGPELTLASPALVEQYGETTINEYHITAPNGDPIGVASVGLRDGKVSALYYVGVDQSIRNQKWGEKVMRALVATTDGDIYVSNTVPEAVGFYEKLGAEWISPEKDHGDATLTFDQYRSARLAAAPAGQGEVARGADDAADGAGPQAEESAAAAEVTSTVEPDVRRAREERQREDAEKAAAKKREEREEETRQAALSEDVFKAIQLEIDSTKSLVADLPAARSSPLAAIDKMFKAVFDVTGVSKGLRATWEQAEKVSQWAADKYPAYRHVLHAVNDRYGKTEAFYNAIRALVYRHTDVTGKLNEFARTFSTNFNALPMDQQAAIATAFRGGPEAMTAIKAMTEDQQKAVTVASKAMKELLDEAVASGLLTKDQVEAEGFSLLPRLYKDELIKNARSTGLKSSRGILGTSMKQTGWTAKTSYEHVVDHTAKRHVEVSLVHDNGSTETWFIPEDAPLSTVNDGRNVEFVGNKPKWTLQKSISDKKTATFYRPYTPQELEAAGAISDPRYVLQVVAHQLMNDVQNARLFQWMLGAGQEKTNAKDRLVFDSLTEAVESDRTLDIKARNWTQVPNSRNVGGGYTFGVLHGKWIPTGIWNDINARVQHKPLFEHWDNILGFWKKTKTAWSPVTHFNNVVSSFALLYYNDIPVEQLSRAFRIYYDSAYGDPGAKAKAMAILKEMERAGANIGSFSANEVRRDMMRKMLQGMGTPGAKTGSKDARLLYALGKWETVKNAASKAGEFGIETYQLEDNVFRLAAYIEGIHRGLSTLQAGKLATDAFVDYHITAPAITALRNTVLPFIAWPYRIVPFMVKTAFYKPWKLATLTSVLYGMNALAVGLAGDDDEARMFLPEFRKGNLGPLPVPRSLRMPFSAGGNPTYLDLANLLPLGDIMQMDKGGFFGAPLPQQVIPGGPLLTVFEAAFGYDAFRDQKIDRAGQSAAENIAGRLKHLTKQMLPNLPIPALTAQGDKLTDMLRDKHGITGSEMSNLVTILSFLGPKLVAQDETEGRAQLGMHLQRIESDYRAAISMAARNEARYGTPDYDKVKARIDTLVERMLKDIEKAKKP